MLQYELVKSFSYVIEFLDYYVPKIVVCLSFVSEIMKLLFLKYDALISMTPTYSFNILGVM